ncbi:MAG: DUF61 family protein [Ignisphaera sp.]|nr:DUF61 family protein [Ignisphaera sp.]MCX8167970.1 DUF61 family protein [Ignisphaera sp.]MDW8085567.1 DUF61 family protein [Ignisphaera sp.]
MSSQEESIIKGLIVSELRIVNKHLPRERLSLHKLINMDIPHVVLRDGTVHFFRKTELKMLCNYIEKDEWDRLLLPIIIIIRPDIDNGVAFVEDALAVKVISRILGIPVPSENMKRFTLHKPYLSILRSQFDTIFQYAISIELEKDGGELPIDQHGLM